MKIGQQIRFIVVNQQANSLYSLTADGQYRNTSLGRDTWKSLIGSNASFQYNCNKEGFNARSDWPFYFSRARISILGSHRPDCIACRPRIGFGAGERVDNSNTCGNFAVFSTDNGNKRIKAMGYILVQ